MDTIGECVETTKRAHTCKNGIIELSDSDTAPDSDLEDELASNKTMNSEQQLGLGSSQRNVSIPPNKVTRQLTFHDLNWKPLKTEEEWSEQRKRLEQLDDKMWGGLDKEEERRKAWNLKKLHQCQLATQRQQRCRERKRAKAADNKCDHRKSINDVRVSYMKNNES